MTADSGKVEPFGPFTPWRTSAEAEAQRAACVEALTTAGRAPREAATVIRRWGRSSTETIECDGGLLWLKFSYRLPPGEEVVLSQLAPRWPELVPTPVATWSGGLALEPLGGAELSDSDPLERWCSAAEALGTIAAGERAHADEWLALGVRDRRPAAYRRAVEALPDSPVVQAMPDPDRRRLDHWLPDFIERFETGFQAAPTLVHQDSGNCNIHVRDDGLVVFDWADVVVGHAVFSGDRLLDQVPTDRADAVIDAFCGPLSLDREEWRQMRRSNVLHEVLRYHDELAYLDEEDTARESLSNSVRSQLKVLIDHEDRRAAEGS